MVQTPFEAARIVCCHLFDHSFAWRILFAIKKNRPIAARTSGSSYGFTQ
jgi:hypothetical protein